MSMSLPANYVVYSITNNGNTLTAVRTNSSPEKPRFLEFTRVPATYNQAQGSFSIPTVTVRAWHGTVDANGRPTPQKIAVMEQFRLPIGTESVEIAEIFADLDAFRNQPDFLADFVLRQILPDNAAV